MLVHPVTVPGSGTRSWTVSGTTTCLSSPWIGSLRMTDIGRSPNTVKAYAHDLFSA